MPIVDGFVFLFEFDNFADEIKQNCKIVILSSSDNKKDIDRIVTYCEKDVIAVAQIFLRLRREDLLIEDEILHV